MTVLSSFEHRLERAVEGFFARVFRSGIHPLEIGKRIQRVMEDGKSSSMNRTYVPNRYRIELSSKDHARLSAVEAQIVEELEIFVSEAAKQRQWVLAGPSEVQIVVDSGLSAGEFRVKGAEVKAGEARPIRPPSEGPQRVAVLALLGPDGSHIRRVKITRRLVLGRGEDCDISLDDRTASRQHAEIVNSADGSWLIRDMKSRNGTTVNGANISEHRLTNGDRIGIGSSALEFRSS